MEKWSTDESKILQHCGLKIMLNVGNIRTQFKVTVFIDQASRLFGVKKMYKAEYPAQIFYKKRQIKYKDQFKIFAQKSTLYFFTDYFVFIKSFFCKKPRQGCYCFKNILN